jgi:outer membrane protein assembly factor BamB
MKKIWHYKDGHMDAFTLIDGDFLYIGSGIPLEDIGKKRAYAYKLEAKTGKLVWKKELALSSWFGPLKSGKRICFIQGELHVKSELGGISCFSPSGERLNSMTIESPIIGKPLVYGDDIVLNDFNGGLYSWNSSSGKFNWKSPSNNKKIKYSYSSVQPLAKNILFVNPRGEVSKVDKESGEVLSIEKFNLKESVFSDPLIYEDGYMLFGMKGTIKYYKR